MFESVIAENCIQQDLHLSPEVIKDIKELINLIRIEEQYISVSAYLSRDIIQKGSSKIRQRRRLRIQDLSTHYGL